MTHPVPALHAPDSVFDAFFKACNGGLVGNGTTRDAYAITCHPDKVIKVAKTAAFVTNWIEIVTYTKIKNNSYFAEIFSWSQSGKYLVMERLTPLSSHTDLKGSSLPKFVGDISKAKNFGISQAGLIKCLDYANIELDDQPLHKFL